MTTIRTFFHLAEAELAVATLRAAGIEAVHADVEGTVAVGAQLATGGIRLQVPDDRAAEALRILDTPAAPAPNAGA